MIFVKFALEFALLYTCIQNFQVFKNTKQKSFFSSLYRNLDLYLKNIYKIRRLRVRVSCRSIRVLCAIFNLYTLAQEIHGKSYTNRSFGLQE